MLNIDTRKLDRLIDNPTGALDIELKNTIVFDVVLDFRTGLDKMIAKKNYIVKKYPQLMESHRELSIPTKNDRTEWNQDYLDYLTTMIMDNFSEERFKHLVEVVEYMMENESTDEGDNINTNRQTDDSTSKAKEIKNKKDVQSNKTKTNSSTEYKNKENKQENSTPKRNKISWKLILLIAIVLALTIHFIRD